MTNQRRAPEALRLRHYVERRKRAKQLDVNKVHAFDAGCGSEAELLLSDIETLLSLVEAQQPTPTPQADSQPAHQWGTGYPPLPAAYYLAGGAVRTWDEGQMRAYVDADRTARAPADPAGDNFGSAEHWKEKAQYWAAAAHRMRQEALRGEPVDGIVHPKADSVLENAARYEYLRDCTMGERNRLEHYSGPALDVVIDAARKQGANND